MRVVVVQSRGQELSRANGGSVTVRVVQKLGAGQPADKIYRKDVA